MNRPESSLRSLCLVLDGEAEVKSHLNDKVIVTLTLGSHFGSSDSLRIIDYEYLGDIYAG